MNFPSAAPTPRLGRAIAVVAVAVTGAVGMGWVCIDSWQQVRRTGAPSLDILLAAVTASGVCLVLAWCALVIVVVALGAVPGRLGMLASAMGRAVAPAGARRRARLALGVAMTTAQLGLVVLPGTAAPRSEAPTSVAASDPAPLIMSAAGDAGIEDLPRIGRPPAAPSVVVPAPRDKAPFPTPSAPVEGESPRDPTHRDRLRDDDSRAADQRRSVTVEPGDTLWSIAADHLDATPSSRSVSQAWPLWFAANRDVIGPDPDLIRPGVVLVEPASPPPTPTRSDR